MGVTDDSQPLLQKNVCEYAFERRGSESWTTLWRSEEGPSHRLAEYAALVAPELVDRVLANESWEVSPAWPGGPTLVELASGGASYSRFENVGIEPLVWVSRGHSPLSPMSPQLSEEFMLLFELWSDGSEVRKVLEDGSTERVARISSGLVEVQTSYLMRYIAARQMHVALYVDSTKYVDDAVVENGPIAIHRGEGCAYSVGAFNNTLARRGSRLLGKRVIAPAGVDGSRLWPFESNEAQFPEFQTDAASNGSPIFTSSDPSRFGALEEHMRVVFFSRDLLQYYYERPERFSVERGYLRCGDRWGLDISNTGLNHVSAFLGDIGERLPEAERIRWRAHNIAPFPLATKTPAGLWKRDPDEAAGSIEFDFKKEYSEFRRDWAAMQGWDLFRPLHGADQHRLARLRIPVNEEQPEFEDQLGHLATVIIERLDGKRAAHGLELPKDSRSIAQLHAFLTASGYPMADRDNAYLKRLQTLRSRVAGAHSKGSDYEALLERLEVEGAKREVIKLFGGAVDLLRDVRAHFYP